MASLLQDVQDARAPVGRLGAPADNRTERRLYGRDHELRVARGLLAVPGRALILEGEPGIGKTAIWRELLSQARAEGCEVLRAMPSGAEVQLTFAALGDLVHGLGDEALAGLPAPQRRALDVALLRADGAAVDARAVGVALLELLRERAAGGRLLLGIDDLQWLDGSSARALGFALRRLEGAAVSVVATLRHGEQPGLELDEERLGMPVQRLTIGPLTLAAIHELVVARTHEELSRPALIALFDAAKGNPFVAGEIAQELARSGAGPGAGGAVPVPASVRQLVGARLERLAPETRELLVLAAGLARPTVELLARVRPDAEATLRPAVEAVVIEPVDERGEIHFTHPLHGRVPYEALEPSERRSLHARLAEVLDDVEERARHLALACEGPAVAVAGELDAAAAVAGARGAPLQAAELCALAVRLTPAECADQRSRRSLAAAVWRQRAGDIEGAGRAAEALVDLPGVRGDVQAQSLSLLASVRADTEGVGAALTLYDRARRITGSSVATRAEIHRRVAWLRLGAGEIEPAGRHARAAVALARGVDPAVCAGAGAVAELAAVMAGGAPVGAAGAETAGAGVVDGWAETAPGLLAAVTLLWAGEIERARPPLEDELAEATRRDEPWLVRHALAYLSAIAVGTGELSQGLAHARRYAELAESGPQRAAALWPLAVAQAWLGDEAAARATVAEGRELARSSGHALYEIGCLSALGLLELSLDRPAEAAAALGRARERAEGCGLRALGRVALLPDSIEALTLAGDLAGATALMPELQGRATRLGSPWALALAWRAEGLLADAQGEPAAAVTAFRRALAEHERQLRPGELARTRLALGRTLRRGRQKRAAREMLEGAGSEFESIGAALWAARARQELGRIGGRSSAAAPGELSATEACIVELVVGGRTNAEIAAALHLSVRTVEWNLSKVYRRFGVRGRTELAAAINARDAGAAGSGGPGVNSGASPG